MPVGQIDNCRYRLCNIAGLSTTTPQVTGARRTGYGFGSSPRYTGLFARHVGTSATTLVAACNPEERIDSFTGLPDGSALLSVARYEGTRITHREQHPVGPLAPFLALGRRPLPGGADSGFGFHALPFHRAAQTVPRATPFLAGPAGVAGSYFMASSSSRQACSQRRQACSQTRQCSWCWACRSHSSPQLLQVAAQASSSGLVTLVS
jgi:hypothetical protein